MENQLALNEPTALLSGNEGLVFYFSHLDGDGRNRLITQPATIKHWLQL